MPVIYKTFNYQTDVVNKPVSSAELASKDQANEIVHDFITLFKQKYLL